MKQVKNGQPLEEAIQQYAKRFGVEPERVRYRVGLTRLREMGIFVGLNVRGTSMFSTTVKWEELGIPTGDVRRARLGKGSKSLVPKELRMTSLEVRLRQCLNRHGLKLDIGLHGVRWLTAAAYHAWRADHDELVKEFEARKQEILDGRAATLEWLEHQFLEVAETAYVTLRNLRRREARQTAINDALGVGGVNEMDRLGRLPISHWDDEGEAQRREQFVAAIISGVLNRYPTQAQIQAELQVDYYCPLLLSQQEWAADHQAALEHLAEADIRHLAVLQAHEQEAHETRKRRIALQAARDKAAAVQRIEIAAARERMEELGNPFEDALLLLREEVNERLLAILATVRKQGFIHGKSFLALCNTLERFNSMSALGDEELAAELATVRHAAAKSAAGKRDTQAVIDALTSAIELTADAAWQAKKRGRMGMRAALLDF